MSQTEQNRQVLEHWYNNMWGKTDFDLIPSIAAPLYLRHDITGANNLMPAENYRDMLKPVLGHLEVQAFTYYLVCEGEYVGALGRYLLPGDKQWDWVQLFRVGDGRLQETWLAGMGGTDPMGYPHARNVWSGTEIPTEVLADSVNKTAVREWLQLLARSGSDRAQDYLAATVRVHDQHGADRRLSAAEYFSAMQSVMQSGEVSDFRYFLIEENNVVFATCSWKLDGERQWDWVQAFELVDGRIARIWLPVIGGTDPSLTVGPQTRWAADALPQTSVELAV